ncbi:hypothetical protein O0235_09415 [Tepidiforma flava]|uniref:MBG domain-containing protein n=1 Tax=Tepidiforma flava TaxID=3004094 RepID=A0ABY7M4S9_9CHLR|nr:hypothetical protein [Tepidiforma flava]WBL35005.1 hypothetical protein O0235_09415 [Tepidiforma flava]
MRKLDAFAIPGIINGVNTIHRQGYGLDNIHRPRFPPGHDGAGDIQLNPVLAANPHQIATAANPNAPGDASIALRIAGLELQPNMAAGIPAANLVTGETLSAGVTLTGLTVAGSLQPGNYTIVENPPASAHPRASSTTDPTPSARTPPPPSPAPAGRLPS